MIFPGLDLKNRREMLERISSQRQMCKDILDCRLRMGLL